MKNNLKRNGPTWAVAGTWRFRPDEQPRDSAMTEVAPKLPQTVRNGIVYVGEGVTFAVPYKHLRAHETVLDLVCRLLLEKKKQLYNLSTTFFKS